MANQCLICLKQLNSKAALKGHTGTADPTLRKPHVCRRCNRPFCSQKAMEQHHDSPAHATFSCDVCNKTFGSKQAVTDHQKSARHNSIVNQAWLARWASTGAAASTGSASSSFIVPHTPAIPSIFASGYTNDSSNTDNEHYGDEGAWACNSYVEQDDDQDWALCDKDCGWCGHCADNVDY